MKTIPAFEGISIKVEDGIVTLKQGKYGSGTVVFPESIWDEIKDYIEGELCAMAPLHSMFNEVVDATGVDAK